MGDGMILKNGKVLNESFAFEACDIAVENGKIVKIGKNLDGYGEEIDIQGKKVIPGYIDIHMHGGVGVGASNADLESYKKLSKHLAESGTTAYLITTLTQPEDKLLCQMKTAKEAVSEKGFGAELLGVNMEGPYLSPARKGAHREEWLKTPEELDFDKANEASGGNILIVTVAPETDGALDFIKKNSGKVKISLGHTAADYDTCNKAFENGAKLVTHIFNAMPSVHHRDLSLIASAFESDAMVELISDGVHIKGSVVKMAYKMFGPDRIIVINDTEIVEGLPDGEYLSASGKVIVSNKVARLEDGTIAGGATSMHDCVKNLISWGIEEENAVKMATYNPAKLLGIKEKGIIKEGADADLNIIDEDFNLSSVYVNGEKFL